ncbi:MAG: zinc finger-like domain-containing protein [Candidatus Helarchaeota archaeon]
MGKIFLNVFNTLLDEIKEYRESDPYSYELKKKSIFEYFLLGDPTLRLPFNLPDSEDDAPFEIIKPIPEEPITEKPKAEKLFEEWKNRISDSILKKLYLPLDFLKNLKLESSEEGKGLVVSIRNLYEAKKVEKGEVPGNKRDDISFYTEDEINNAPREAPVAYEEKTYIYPIQGTDTTEQCPDCSGTGVLSCSDCENGMTKSGTKCSTCKGTGTTPCERCGGTGNIIKFDMVIWKWIPFTDYATYCTFDINIEEVFPEITPEGTNFVLRVEEATLDEFDGDEELLNRAIEMTDSIRKISNERKEYNGFQILKIELQRSEAEFAPIVKLVCKYKEKSFDVYSIGIPDRLHVFKAPNIPKTFKIIFIILVIIVGILATILILNLLPI